MYGKVCFLLYAVLTFQRSYAGLIGKNKITFVKLEFVASDPNIMNMQLKVEEKSDSEKEISGFIFFTKTVDRETFDSCKVMTSPNSMDLKKMKPVPFLTLPTKETPDYMNDIYKPFIMPTTKTCSNLPVFEDAWGDRSLAGNYTVNKCILNTDNMQALLNKGNYCLLVEMNKDTAPKFKGELRVFLKVE